MRFWSMLAMVKRIILELFQWNSRENVRHSLLIQVIYINISTIGWTMLMVHHSLTFKHIFPRGTIFFMSPCTSPPPPPGTIFYMSPWLRGLGDHFQRYRQYRKKVTIIAIIAIKTETHIITCCELFKWSPSVFLFNLTTFDFVIELRLECDLGDWIGEVAQFMATVSVLVFIESTDGVFLFVSMTLSGAILAILPLGTSNDSTDFLKHRGQKDDCNVARWNYIRANSYQRKIKTVWSVVILTVYLSE